MLKRIFFIFIIIFINLAVIFVIGEVYARVKHGGTLEMKAREASYRRADFELHHSFIPGAKGRSVTEEWNVPYEINSHGLRDREYSPEKREGVYRILALGDSFTEGYGVEAGDAFIKLLEKKLNLAGGGYEVINCGIASYSPLLEYLFLKEKGLGLDPDMVVLFYDFGDLKDDLEYERTTFFGPGGVPLRCVPLKRVRAFSDNPVERFLVRHSRFYLYLENRINKLLYKLRKIGFDQYVKDNISGREHKLSGEGEKIEVSRFIAFSETDGDRVKKLWKINEKYLDLIYGMLRERGIAFVLVSYPNAVEVDGEAWSRGREEYGFVAGRVYPEPAVVDIMREYAEKRDIPLVNLYGYFRGNRTPGLFFDFDGHFTKKGHRVMAEGLFEELRSIL
ncbi:MAG: SGNH/GDSL hydrolase family protein [Candidatus Omnitrophota bacterium]|nr:SGNH/GDSL hydrolase family protein [Candidatus Omnitrophota bacterium]